MSILYGPRAEEDIDLDCPDPTDLLPDWERDYNSLCGTCPEDEGDDMKLSIYEDNAGGVHLHRHSDNLSVSGLEHYYSVHKPLRGEAETLYWLKTDEAEMRADGWEPKRWTGEECGTLIASYDGIWTLHGADMGLAGIDVFGLTREFVKEARAALRDAPAAASLERGEERDVNTSILRRNQHGH